MGDVEQSAGMVTPGGGGGQRSGAREGPLGAGGTGTTSETKPKNALHPSACCAWGGGSYPHSSGPLQPAVQGRQAWGPVEEVPTSSAHESQAYWCQS